MNASILLRVSLLVAVHGMALAAHAEDAYNNLGSPVSYSTANGVIVDSGTFQGFQFAASATGLLSVIQAGINNFPSITGAQPLGLKIYADNGADRYGSLLGTYAGASTGAGYNVTSNALSVVVASGEPVTITSGAKYWIEASTTSSARLIWNFAARGSAPHNGNGTYSPGDRIAAFSVQVNPVPEPSTVAALGLGAVAMLRRRKRI